MKDNLIWMKDFMNNRMKYKLKHMIKIIIIKERFVCWYMDEIKPANIVIIITKLAKKFNEFNS